MSPTAPPLRKYTDFSGYGTVIVICGFILYLIPDGIANNLGLVNSIWLTEFKQSETATSWIGSMLYAVPLLTAPITAQLIERFGCRPITIVFGLIGSCGYVLSAFCTSIQQLYVTIGLMSGFGASAMFLVGILSAERWFENRRSLAIGFVSAGTGCGTFVIAPATQRLLDAYGWRQTMYLMAALNFFVTFVGCFIKEPQWVYDEMRGRRGKGGGVFGIWKRKSSNEMDCDKRKFVRIDKDKLFGVDNMIEVCDDEGQKAKTRFEPKADLDVDGNAISGQSYSNSNGIDKPGQENLENEVQFRGYGQNKEHNLKLSKCLNSALPIENSTEIHQNGLNHTDPAPKFNENLQITSKNPEIFTIFQNHPQAPQNPTKFPRILKKIVAHFGNRNFSLLAAATFAIYALYSIPMYFIVELLRDFGYTEAECANFISIIGIALLIGMVALGYVGDVSGHHVKNVNAVCTLLCGAAEALLPVCAVNSIAFGTCSVVFGFTFATAYVLIPKIAELIVGVDEFATAIGLNFFVQGLAMLLGIPFASMIFEMLGSWTLTFHICGAIIACGSIFAYFINVKQNEDEKKQRKDDSS